MNLPKTTKAWTQLEWGHTCREKGQNEQAATYYQTARRLFRAEGCQKGLFAACTQLGHHCEIGGDLDGSLQYFQEALAACSPSRSLRDLAEAEGNVGFIKQSQSRFAEATAYYRKSIQHAQEGGDTALAAKMANNMGNLYMQQNDLAEAQQWLQHSRDLYDDDVPGNLLNSLGQLALRRSDPEQALRHFTAGLAAARQQGTPLEVALQLGSIASVCRDLGHLERALSSGNEALGIYVTQGHAQGRCGMATLLADLYMTVGDLAMAQRHILASMDLCRQLGNARMQAFNYVSLGNLYAQQDGDKQRALNEWVTALRLFRQLGMEMQSQAVIRAMAA
ncbi:MAG: tetratricopeptide repeat protein [Gemmatimonadetes bacterium]|nr:tetratricopeptide repeat protein [Gemmatimonadota bacterium]